MEPSAPVAPGGETEISVNERRVMMTFRFQVDLINRLRELARRNERTLTAELMRAVRHHVENSPTGENVA